MAKDNNAGGTVTSIATGTGLTGGTITTTGTISMANMAANTIKGNNTASTAAPTDIAVGANTVLGRKGGNIVAEQVSTAQIEDNAVTNTKIANDAVNSAKIQDNTVTDADLTTTGVGAGTYTKVTVNAQGRVTSGSSLAAADIPSGSNNYIQNQFSSAQNAEFYIDGRGRLQKSLFVSMDNTTGGGIVLSDDGDIVDNNDGFASHRFSLGLRVMNGNGAAGTVVGAQISGNSANNTYFNAGNNVGIGNSNPTYILDVSDRMRLRTNGGNSAGIWFNNLANSGLVSFIGTRDDNLFGIYGVGVNDWQFNFDRRSGNVGIGVTPSATIGENKLIISRDNLGTFTSNATLSLADNTASSGRRASIAWHNGGESEGVMQLIQNSINGVSSRRIQLFDNQSQGLGLEMSGRLWYGNAGSRTETRDNAGLQGNAGAQSGFFETSSPSNFYSGASSWQHLIDVRHNNPANNYAMQIAGSFFDQDAFIRKTNNSATQSWSRILTSRNVAYYQDRVNTYSHDAANAGYRVVGSSTNTISVNSGDVVVISHTSKFRWTGGSGGDHPFYGVRVTGACGTINLLDVERIGTADDFPRGQWQVIATNYVWVATCSGNVEFTLIVDNNSDADDTSNYRDIVLFAQRY